jgi:hypothetical protein
MARDDEKTGWLYAYDAEITKRLKDCTKRGSYPTWQHLPAGHMRFAQGKTPKQAATEYLAETKYGRQACTKSAASLASRRRRRKRR